MHTARPPSSRPTPPPARPHVALNPHFSSFGISDWAEDDAWDSTSDSESPNHSSHSLAWNRSQNKSGSTPKPVPKPARNSSSSTLAFSYTHVQAPSPSSYSPRPEPFQAKSSRNGWTLVTKSTDRRESQDNQSEGHRDLDTDGNLDPDFAETASGGEVEIGSVDDLEQSAAEQKQPTISRQYQGPTQDEINEIVNDPLYSIRRPSKTPSPSDSSSIPQPPDGSAYARSMREQSIKTNRRHKFVEALSKEDIDIAEIRKLSWNGVPNDLRPVAWQILLGYLPLPKPLRSSTLARKRQEYASLVELAFARGREGLDQTIWHQIEIDVPRTRPGVQLWMHAATQRSLERILYVWAIRHPASGYVQGINDLATPFFQVFMTLYIDSDPELFDPALLPPNVLNAVEADSFWCLSRLLDGIQDNYISGQPGIQRGVKRMAELVARIDAPLAAHLESESVEFMQFAFRWMNCLLMREISVQNTIRMWDTYLSEGAEAFSQFHLYVCSAFLVRWSDKLRTMDFQGIIMFLQSLPTQNWGDHEIELLLSEAFVLNSIWHNAQSHFSGK